MTNIADYPLTMIVVSYFPLLRGVAGQTIDVNEFAKDFVGLERHNVASHACLWFKDEADGCPYPVLVIDKMSEVVDHMMEWSEGKPADWFDLKIVEFNGRYAVVLVPKIERSIERFKLAYQLRVGYPIPTTAKFQVVFDSLGFVSESISESFKMFQKMAGKSIKLAVVDRESINRDNPAELEMDSVRVIGEFSVDQSIAGDHMTDQYVRHMMTESE